MNSSLCLDSPRPLVRAARTALVVTLGGLLLSSCATGGGTTTPRETRCQDPKRPTTMVGLWHADPAYDGAWNDRYRLNADGTYEHLIPDSPRRSGQVIGQRGVWSVCGEKMQLIPNYELVIGPARRTMQRVVSRGSSSWAVQECTGTADGAAKCTLFGKQPYYWMGDIAIDAVPPSKTE